jgi:dihydrofolate reductase
MGRLVYTALTSLDGFVADENGSFDWATPDEAVHAFVNELERGIGTHLYGRRMYDVMVAWETMPLEGEPAAIREYAEIWRAADKVVYSTTLDAPASARTRIERIFDPEAVRAMKSSTGGDLGIGGPALAAQAIRAGLVDDYHFLVAPIVVGGGNPALPRGVRVPLELVGERRFPNGTVYSHYRARE